MGDREPRPASGYDPAGNLLHYTDLVMGTWDFTYDTLNRLVTADSAADAPAPFTNNYGCWSYDTFGNRTAESMSGTNYGSNPPLASFASYAPGSNQFASTSQSLGGVPMPGITAMTG